MSEQLAFNLDAIASFLENISDFQERESKEQFLSAFVKSLSQTLGILFVGVYLVDEDMNWLIFHAGSHEKISNIVSEHAPRMRMLDHSEFFGQAGAALGSGEIRFVDWLTGNIIGYEVANGNVHEKNVTDHLEPFQSPWYGAAELYFPLEYNEKKIGVLEFRFDTATLVKHTEIIKVQLLASRLAMVLAEGKNA